MIRGEPSHVIDPEARDVGELLRRRRIEYKVMPDQMCAGGGLMSRDTLLDIEGCAQPYTADVRLWYAAFLAEAAKRVSWANRSYAERNQWYTTSADNDLHRQAYTSALRVAWWWGKANTSSPRGAWCYLCSRIIHRYDVSTAMSHAARVAVMAHRAEHVIDLCKNTQSKTQEVSQ